MIHPVPKPPVRAKRTRAPLRNKKRMKSRNSKRKGSSFPKQRNPAHCRWVIEETPCVGAGRFFKRPVSMEDVPGEYLNHIRPSYHSGWWHNCWGPHDPAHVGEHRAKGAPDLGHVVNMCRALHDFYDQHRSEFAKVTGLTERRLENLAGGNGLRWVESGGSSTPQGAAQ